MKNEIPQLTEQYFKMMHRLNKGYPTHREKLDNLFFSNEPLETKVMITKPIVREEHTCAPKKPTQEKSGTSRVLSGRVDIQLVYPVSGNIYPARIRSWGNMCAVEPIEPDTAYWLIDRIYLKGDVVDLRTTPHMRQYHNKEGREFLSNFR